MDTSELVHCLQLVNPRDISREITPRPHVFRWFVTGHARRGLADRCAHDQRLSEQWVRPLETNNLPGHLTVPVVLRAHHQWPMAAPAFLLPLCWQSGSHSPLTPQSLRELADRVLMEMFESKSLHEHFPEARSDWGIRWCEPGWEDFDLVDLAVWPESAYASLAIGLASAVQDQTLATELLATGYRNPDSGKWEVNATTLSLKLDAGIEAGKKTFAVPSVYVDAVKGSFRLNEVQGQVVGLEDDPKDLYRAVQPAVLLAGIEPGPHASRADRVTWYLTRPTHEEAANFYRRLILDEVIGDMKKVLESAGLGQWRPEHLVSIVSDSEELVVLALELFSPKYCHVIYTWKNENMKYRFKKIETWIEDKNRASAEDQISLEPVRIEDSHAALGQLVTVVGDLSRNEDSGSVLIDSTPGKRAMSMAALQGGKAGDRVLCWWHDRHPGTRRAIPFSLKMLLWEIGSDRALIPLLGPSRGDCGELARLPKK